MQSLRDQSITPPDQLGRVEYEKRGIGVGQRPVHEGVQPFPERSPGFVDTRCVNKDELRVLLRQRHDPTDRISSGLRPTRSYRDLLSNQRVHEGRLSHIRSADDRDETRTRIEVAHARLTLTLATRLPRTVSAVNTRPSRSKASPSSGTRPASSSTKPPTVSHSSDGRSTPTT